MCDDTPRSRFSNIGFLTRHDRVTKRKQSRSLASAELSLVRATKLGEEGYERLSRTVWSRKFDSMIVFLGDASMLRWVEVPRFREHLCSYSFWASSYPAAGSTIFRHLTSKPRPSGRTCRTSTSVAPI